MKLGPDLMKVLTIFNQKFTILQQQQQTSLWVQCVRSFYFNNHTVIVIIMKSYSNFHFISIYNRVFVPPMKGLDFCDLAF